MPITKCSFLKGRTMNIKQRIYKPDSCFRTVWGSNHEREPPGQTKFR